MTASLTFIGTATTVLRLGPFTLLTDPNFVRRGERVHLGYGLTSKRRTDPALTPAQLPSFDALVLSHVHGRGHAALLRPVGGRGQTVDLTPG